MRLLVDTFGHVRLCKDRNLIGLPRWVIEFHDNEFGWRHTKILSGIRYNREKAIEIAKQIQKQEEEWESGIK